MKNYDNLNSSTAKHAHDEVDEQGVNREHNVRQSYDGVNMFCLIGMICSILGLVVLLMIPLGAIILGILGFILSAVGLYNHNRTNKRLSGRGMGVVGIAIPILAILFLFGIRHHYLALHN